MLQFRLVPIDFYAAFTTSFGLLHIVCSAGFKFLSLPKGERIQILITLGITKETIVV